LVISVLEEFADETSDEDEDSDESDDDQWITKIIYLPWYDTFLTIFCIIYKIKALLHIYI
jgi:hypothetical protein